MTRGKKIGIAVGILFVLLITTLVIRGNIKSNLIKDIIANGSIMTKEQLQEKSIKELKSLLNSKTGIPNMLVDPNGQPVGKK